ncbi:MAG: glycosyltransferase family 2 protein [Candidatus Bipolaricaulota bacterium]
MISVVVPVLDEEELLEGTLRSLRRQTFRDFELLVVDNGSTDRSPQIAARLADRMLVEPQRGALWAMHRGFREARGDLIACGDADTIYPRLWLERMVQALLEPGTVAAYGPMGFRESPRALRPLDAGAYCVVVALSRLGRVHLAGAANFGMRREAYFAVGGYPTYEGRASPDFRLALALEGVGRVRFVPTMPCYTSNRRFVRAGRVRAAGEAFRYWLDVASGADRIPAERYWSVPHRSHDCRKSKERGGSVSQSRPSPPSG